MPPPRRLLTALALVVFLLGPPAMILPSDDNRAPSLSILPEHRFVSPDSPENGRPSASPSGIGGVIGFVNVGTNPSTLAVDYADGFLFVANWASSTVSVVNTSTDAVVATVPVSEGPAGVAVDELNDEVYIACPESSNLTVINGNTLMIATTISIPDPAGITVDDANGHVFVTDPEENVTRVIDGGTGSVLATIPVGVDPVELTYDDHNGRIYVVNEGSDNVSVIDGSADVVVGSIPVGSSPDGLIVDGSNDTLFVVDEGSVGLTVVNTTSDGEVWNLTLFGDPLTVAIDDSVGLVYVTNFGGSNVTVIDSASRQILGSIEVGLQPSDIIWDNTDGLMYVADWGSGTVKIIEPGVATYPVTFEETGLLPDTGWTVTFNGVAQGSNSSTLNFSAPSGTGYPFTVTGGVEGYTREVPVPEVGTLQVEEGAALQVIAFRPPSIEGLGWGLLNATIHPPPLFGAMMAYDAVDGYVVLFGGMSSSGSYNWSDKTWAFQNGRWTELEPAESPGARQDALMATDPQTGCVILFGGFPGDWNDTWRFCHGEWTLENTSTVPLARNSPAYAMDPACDCILMFGGQGPNPQYSQSLSDTWEFKDGDWTELNLSVHPSARVAAQMAYDGTSRSVILFSGAHYVNSTDPYNDTWEFLNGTWHQVSPENAPPGVAGGKMVSLPGPGGALLVTDSGGASPNQVPFVTWEFRDGDWSMANTTAAVIPRSDAAVAYDSADGLPVLFGGYTDPEGIFHDTWVYNTSTVTFDETGLPIGTAWSVNLGQENESTTTNAITFLHGFGIENYSISTGSPAESGIRYRADPPVGQVATVAGNDTAQDVSFVEQFYLALNVSPEGWGETNGSSGWVDHGSIVDLDALPASELPSGPGFCFDQWLGEGPGSYTGSVSPISIVPAGPVNETAVFEPCYTVTILELGLPRGLSWSLWFDSQVYRTTNSSLSFSEPNGVYSFSVGPVAGYVAAPASGTIFVSDSTTSKAIHFAQIPAGSTSLPTWLSLPSIESCALIGIVAAVVVVGIAVVALRGRGGRGQPSLEAASAGEAREEAPPTG
jgi:YVTN family beta-propeller protein